jgi:hypothetical protein
MRQNLDLDRGELHSFDAVHAIANGVVMAVQHMSRLAVSVEGQEARAYRTPLDRALID